MEEHKRKRQTPSKNEEDIDIEYNELVVDLNSISINYNNMDLLLKIIKKMDKLDKKIDDFSKIEIKIEKLVINLCVGESGDKLTKAAKVNFNK